MEKEKVWFKNTGGGIHRARNGRIIKPNEKFKEYPENISENFRDVIVPLEKLPEPEDEKVEIVETTYKLDPLGGGWYNIVDSNGKKMNEKGVRRPDGLKLIKDLKG